LPDQKLIKFPEKIADMVLISGLDETGEGSEP